MRCNNFFLISSKFNFILMHTTSFLMLQIRLYPVSNIAFRSKDFVQDVSLAMTIHQIFPVCKKATLQAWLSASP